MSRIPMTRLPLLEFLELEECTAAIDWRAEEREVIDAIAAWVDPAGGLVAIERGDALFFRWRGQEHRIPLTYTRHDRYVALGSLAAAMASEYQFWLLTARLRDDTHSVLVLSTADSMVLQAKYPDWVADHLTRFVPGTDYFSDLKVPYLGNERHNPSFRWHALKLRVKQRMFELVAGLVLRAVLRRRW
jgi:hypothetical protein